MEDRVLIRRLNFSHYHDRKGGRETVVPKFTSFQPPQGSPTRTSPSTDGPNYSSHPSVGRVPELRDYRAANESKPPDPFVIDRAGDPKNVTFGRLHQHAAYHRFGAGAVLGTGSGQKIDRMASTEKVVAVSCHWEDSLRKGKYEGSALKGAVQSHIRYMKVKSHAFNSSGFDNEVDFVPLSATKGIKRRRTSDTSTPSSDQDDSHYRSLAGKAKVKDVPHDSDLVYVGDDSSLPEQRVDLPSALTDSVQKKRMELSRQIDDDPANTDSWLDLIKLHDHGLRTVVEQKANADVKLSIYEKALRAVKCSSGRELLLLGRMGEGARIWDNERLLSEWQRTLKDNPKYPNLWKTYLDIRQTSFTSFRYEQTFGIFAECLGLLHQCQGTLEGLLPQQENIYELQIYVILRMALFMRESGFESIAGWQALLEYEFHKHSKFKNAEHKTGGALHSVTRSNFEEFWDSEVPRIGEVNCRGWASFTQEAGNPPQPRTGTASTVESVQGIWKSWVDSERMQGLMSRISARTIDGVSEDDPYQVVLFSDVRPFLIDAPSAGSRNTCLDAFLTFCHLPSCQGDPTGKSRAWRRDGFLRNEMLCARTTILQAWDSHITSVKSLELASDTVSKWTTSRRDLFDLPLSDYQLSQDTLFAVTGCWFAAFDAWQDECADDNGPVQKTWVLRSLQQLVATGAGGDTLAEYLLALELRLSPATVKKSARGLLKKRPSSLLLYNAYALIEYRLGNPCKGENAIITSINMARSLGDDAQRDSTLLWRTWIWELLSAGHSKEALIRMMMYGDKVVQSSLPATVSSDNHDLKPTLLLRTEQALTSTRDHMLSQRSYRQAAHAIECLILFRYLNSSGSLSAANVIFKSNVSILSTRGVLNPTSLEYLHQSFARLIYQHVTHTHLVKPSEVRSYLTESISLFPRNTIFLSFYAWNEARFRIDDRVRSIVKDVVLRLSPELNSETQESVVSHFFAVYTELNRGVTLGSNNLAIHSTFERAVGSNSGAHCAGLWKLYFIFERSREDITRAKSVFWRGVKACPWAKELYMLAFEFLRVTNGLRDEELRGVYELMEEKEIRIHVSLENKLKDMDDSKARPRV